MSRKKSTRRCLGLEAWERLICRWSVVPDMPEKRLLVRVIAQAISDAEESAVKHYSSIGNGWRTRAVVGYCRMLGIDPDFLSDQVKRAGEHFGLKEAA